MHGRSLCTIGLTLIAAIAWAGAAAWKAPVSAKGVKNPVARADALKVGRALFEENCVICHGKAGKGDGEARRGHEPPSRSPSCSRTSRPRATGSCSGRSARAARAMPAWKALPEKERWSLVHFIRALAGKKLARHQEAFGPSAINRQPTAISRQPSARGAEPMAPNLWL